MQRNKCYCAFGNSDRNKLTATNKHIKKTRNYMKAVLTLFAAILTMNVFSQQGWQFQNSNLSTNEFGTIYALNKDTVYVTADNGVFNKTYDGGTTWFSLNSGFTESFFDLVFYNSDTGYCVGQNGKIIKTINGGSNWSALPTGTTKSIFSIFIKSEHEIWAVGDSGLILTSINYGLTWSHNSITNKRLNSIAFRNSIGIIVGNDGTLLKSINNGANWTIENSATTEDLFSLCITPNFAYALAGNVTDFANYYNADQVLKTNDYTNWLTLNLYSGLPGLSKMIFVNDSVGFNLSSSCTTNGECGIIIQKTSDSASSWSMSFSNWNPPSGWVGIEYSDFSFVNDTIVYALCGNNILKTSDGGIFVNVKDIKETSSVKMYPNPLNTDILNFENACNTETELEIYDMNGKLLIKTILSDSKENINLSRFNNGIYLVKLFHGSIQSETKKLVILK